MRLFAGVLLALMLISAFLFVIPAKFCQTTQLISNGPVKFAA